MSDFNTTLSALAAKNAACVVAHTAVKAILLTGSVGRGQADGYSDLDLILYYEALPTAAERDAIFAELRGRDRHVLFDVPEIGSGEQYVVEGVACQLAHLTLAAAENDIAEVVEQYSIAPDKLAVVGGILDGRALHGAEIIGGWKAKAAHFPEPLAQNLVRSQLQFYPLWVLEKMMAARGDALYLMEVMIQAAKNLLGILCSLNGKYAPHEWKRMDSILGSLAIAPNDLADRLRHMLRAEPTEAVAELGRLIDETLDLVAAHLPTIETALVRERLHSAPLGLAAR